MGNVTKKAILAIVACLLLMMLGCKNDGDGLTTPYGLLSYTPQGGAPKADLFLKPRFTGEVEYNQYWYGWTAKVTIDDVVYYFPIENYLGLESESGSEEDSVKNWYLKYMAVLDNSIIAENHWPYPQEEYDNEDNYTGYSSMNVGFHAIDHYAPGFLAESDSINLEPGHNEFIYEPNPPGKKYPSYYSWISGLVYDVDNDVNVIGTRRMMNFPLKVYLGRFVQMTYATSEDDSEEVYLTGYSSVENEQSLLNSLDINTPADIVMELFHQEAKDALNKWVKECDKISFELTDEPERADISIYWTDQLSGAYGVTYSSDPNYSVYSTYTYKPTVFLSFVDQFDSKGLMGEKFRAKVVLHELGHALGLWGHSPYEGDIMYAYEPRPSQGYFLMDAELSQGDINSINTLYEVVPVYTNLPANEYIDPPAHEDFNQDFIF